MTDPTIDDLRAQISANDGTILEAVNRRLELVRELKAYKASQGIEFVDPDRERQMLENLERSNHGPLTVEGLRRFFAELLALTKREVG